MSIFWDVAPCSLVEIDRCFRGAYCLHHQGDVGPTHNRILPHSLECVEMFIISLPYFRPIEWSLTVCNCFQQYSRTFRFTLNSAMLISPTPVTWCCSAAEGHVTNCLMFLPVGPFSFEVKQWSNYRPSLCFLAFRWSRWSFYAFVGVETTCLQGQSVAFG
jgi:hypothetical protein